MQKNDYDLMTLTLDTPWHYCARGWVSIWLLVNMAFFLCSGMSRARWLNFTGSPNSRIGSCTVEPIELRAYDSFDIIRE